MSKRGDNMKENGFPRLKQFRLGMKMNQKDFANSIGLNLSTYSNYETGAREPDSDFWIAISKKYGVSIDFLLGLNERSPASERPEAEGLTKGEHILINNYRCLNDDGKVAAQDSVEALTYMPKYKKCSDSKNMA